MRILVRRLAALAFFGSWASGKVVKFVGTSTIYLNLGDNRGKAVWDRSGVTQPKITYLWNHLVRLTHPTLVLDIGANYGEIALSALYENQTQIILCEPSPEITPFLRRSIASHTNCKRMKLVEKLISGANGRQSFYVDKKWSGTSSVIGPIHEAAGEYRGAGSEVGLVVEIDSITIDELCGGKLGGQRLLFKIDVEGLESSVLRGMEKTLRNVASFVGIVEFDKRYLKKAGVQTEAFFGQLCGLGTLMNVQSGEIYRKHDLAHVPTHCDLVVSNSVGFVPGVRYPSLMISLLDN